MDHHVAFSVKDLDKIIFFYQDVLGFIILDLGIREGTEAAAPLGLSYVKYRILRVILPKGDFFLQIIHFEDTSDSLNNKKTASVLGFHHVGIEIENIEEMFQRLKKYNVKTRSSPIVMKESGVKVLFTQDPEGNTIEFVEFPEEISKDIKKRVEQLRKIKKS